MEKGFALKYINLPAELFLNKKIDKTSCIVFAMIHLWDTKPDHCFASNKAFSERLGLSEATVSASISVLIEEQYVKKVSFNGRKRVLKINEEFRILYKEKAEEMYAKSIEEDDQEDEKSPWRLPSSPLGGCHQVPLEHINNSILKEDINTSSKEDDGSPEPSETEQICFDNLRPIRTDPYRNFTEGVKELFLYWNSLGDPIPYHKTDPKAKSFTRSLSELDILLKRDYSKEEIKQSMANYKWLLGLDSFLLRRVSGTVVGLCDFIKFSNFQVDQIKKFNKLIVEKGVDSWFVECLNVREVLESRWSKLKPNPYPKETEKLKQLWKEFGGRKLHPVDDENIFRQISIKAHTYFENLNGKYQWGTEERHIIARLHHLFDVGQSEGWTWAQAQPTFLLSPKMFSEKLPAHWEKIAMAEALSDAEIEEMNNTPEARERMEFNSHISNKPSTRAETMAIIAAQKQTEVAVEDLKDY